MWHEVVILSSLYDSVSILTSQIQDVHAYGTKGEIGQIQLKDRYIFQVSTYKRTIEQVMIMWGNIIV